MAYSIYLFCVMFVVIWIMHKPFDVHSSKTWVNKVPSYSRRRSCHAIHDYTERVFEEVKHSQLVKTDKK